MTDMETTALKKDDYSFQEEGACHAIQGHVKKPQSGSGGSRSEGRA